MHSFVRHIVVESAQEYFEPVLLALLPVCRPAENMMQMQIIGGPAESRRLGGGKAAFLAVRGR